jgi:hypothetical protein
MKLLTPSLARRRNIARLFLAPALRVLSPRSPADRRKPSRGERIRAFILLAFGIERFRSARAAAISAFAFCLARSIDAGVG